MSWDGCSATVPILKAVLTGWLLSEGGNSGGIVASEGPLPARPPPLPTPCTVPPLLLPAPSSPLPLPARSSAPQPLIRTFLQTQVLLLDAWGSGEKVHVGLHGPPPTPRPISLTLLESGPVKGVVVAGVWCSGSFPVREGGTV